MSNLRIWSQVAEVPPEHTKPVSLGRRQFTAVHAYYKFQRATEVFGPSGLGWGWELQSLALEPTTQLWVAELRLWWAEEATQNWLGTVAGTAPALVGREGKVDADAPKKAITDALTKSLSYLGFAARVFLGQYDPAEAGRYFEAQEAAQARGVVSNLLADLAELNPDRAEKARASVSSMELGAAAVALRAALDQERKAIDRERAAGPKEPSL